MREMNERQFRFGDYGVCLNPLIIAQLPYDGVGELTEHPDKANCVTSCRTGEGWAAGYQITTRSGHFTATVGKFSGPFDTQFKAVEFIVKKMSRLLSLFSPDDREFVRRLCEKAYDNVQPTLF